MPQHHEPSEALEASSASALSRNSLCFCGSGKELRHCHPRSAPDSRAMHMTDLYRQVDHVIDDYHEHSTKHPPCAAGCSSCCSDYFPVSQVEFELLLSYMEHSWSKHDIREAFEQAERNLEIFQQDNPPMYDALVNRTNRKQELDSIRHHAGRNSFACPLLDREKGICRVYPVRPFICRTHGSSHTFYGTFKERLMSERVCQHIPSSRAHRRVTPNIVDYWQPYEQLADVYVGAQRQPLRQYPIFYWLVLYNRHGAGPTAQIGNRDNFDLSLEQHNDNMAAHGK
ncbi:YkgJ family cysteine cluster protein [Paenibacillus sp. WLX2291]|uniref:YkgJ family cysteine cluster protein n=1 Tax=Paenibacillus sp. WLX2291 TaxID=3296934 RepID=UPI0039840C87